MRSPEAVKIQVAAAQQTLPLFQRSVLDFSPGEKYQARQTEWA